MTLVIEPDVMERLNQLCDLRARPPTIRALLPALPEAFVLRRWQEIVGRRPPRGPLPHTLTQFLASPAKRLEASYVIAQLVRLRELGIADNDALIQIYRGYLREFAQAAKIGNDQPLSFDRMYCLVHGFTSSHAIVLTECGSCHCRYVISRGEVPSVRLCPIHSALGIRPAELRAKYRDRKRKRDATWECSPPAHAVGDAHAPCW